MKKSKIDKRLLCEVGVLNAENDIECLVFGKDFEKTKICLNEHGVKILNEYLFIKLFHCVLKKSEIYALSNSPLIVFISSIVDASSMMYISKKILGVDETNYTGKDISIAFVDTGIFPHTDFVLGENRIDFFKDFVNEKTSPYDDNGHGTFVCGACSGSGFLSAFKNSGVAPKSRIVSLKALDANGEASATRILNAMEWIFDNHKKRKIKIVCMSFGSEPLGFNDPIMIGANALWNSGVVVVAAGGNSGPKFQTIKSPGISSSIITVGGLDDNRIDNKNFNKNFFEIANFSSRGPALNRIKPDLVAPSVEIVSCGLNDDYVTMSGTSVATPMIAGMCALILEKHKNLTPNEVKKLLLRNCSPLGFDKNMEGYGLPNFKNFLV